MVHLQRILPLAAVVSLAFLAVSANRPGEKASHPEPPAVETAATGLSETQDGTAEVAPLLAEAGASDLYAAAAAGHTEVVQTILDHMKEGRQAGGYYSLAYDIDTAGVDGNTPLHAAAANGHKDIVKLLLQAGSSIAAENKDGQTPLSLANSQGHESVALLLEQVPQLIAAAKAGDEKQVKTLLAGGAFPDGRASDIGLAHEYPPGHGGATPLHHAAEAGHREVVKLLIKAGATVDAPSPRRDYQTPLHLAASNNHMAVVKLLVEAEANLNVRNRLGSTPLSMAARGGNAEIVRLLLQAGADPNIPYNNPPLLWGVENNQSEIVCLLLQAGADVGPFGLYGAIANGHTATVKTIIDHHYDLYGLEHINRTWELHPQMQAMVDECQGFSYNIDAASVASNTPLHVAAANGHGDIVKLLLQVGFSITAENKNGQTPLDLANGQGHESVALLLEQVPKLIAAATAGDEKQVKTLLARGAFPDGRDGGTIPLYNAVEKGHREVVKLLIEAGANVNAWSRSYFYDWPLHSATNNHHTAIVKLLIEAGADIDMRNEFGFTPLYLAVHNNDHHLAARNGDMGSTERGSNPEIAKLLIEAGADPDIPNKYSQTPLFLAVQNREEPELVDLLIQAGANVNAADRFGATPLRSAAGAGSLEIAQALLQAGAQVNPDPSSLSALYDGNTPLHAAIERRLGDPAPMVRLLVENGADVNAKNNGGKTPLDLAEENGHGELIPILQAAGGQQGG